MKKLEQLEHLDFPPKLKASSYCLEGEASKSLRSLAGRQTEQHASSSISTPTVDICAPESSYSINNSITGAIVKVFCLVVHIVTLLVPKPLLRVTEQ